MTDQPATPEPEAPDDGADVWLPLTVAEALELEDLTGETVFTLTGEMVAGAPSTRNALAWALVALRRDRPGVELAQVADTTYERAVLLGLAAFGQFAAASGMLEDTAAEAG